MGIGWSSGIADQLSLPSIRRLSFLAARLGRPCATRRTGRLCRGLINDGVEEAGVDRLVGRRRVVLARLLQPGVGAAVERGAIRLGARDPLCEIVSGDMACTSKSACRRILRR